ncbi:aromatic amino acid DMT transporter YddG [uncultured Acinetobacter sp.]|uniref:aromatic amino acid DMT transporter YddG n=1 Tax=uncultured Acinetobacter sp. TaxID=165433 RepID=UPI0026298739|nr:aromatic amino acid DMT transporter YddG [uncultured Acinetobacter sp.]
MLLRYLPQLTPNTATLIGLSAVFLWSSNVGLMRSVSQSFGAVAGAALIYTLATLILFFTIGLPKLKDVPKRYLFWGSLLFIAYELCFALAIGYAQNSRQAIEVGMINYLWPTFTLLFAILLNNVKANGLIVPGCAAAMIGIFLVLSAETGLNMAQVWANLLSNPLSYSLAFAAAILWGLYCAVTVRTSQGHNVVTLFFALVAVVLWIKYAFIGAPSLIFTVDNSLILLLAAAGLGLGYGTWNIGILSGNMTLLAGASYFTPVLSAVFAAFFLSTSLSWIFWQGVLCVTLGAVLCWLATRQKSS